MITLTDIYINPDYCKGCMYCVEYCPQEVYDESNRVNEKGYPLPEVVNLEECIDCGICVSYCPDFAIVIENEEE